MSFEVDTFNFPFFVFGKRTITPPEPQTGSHDPKSSFFVRNDAKPRPEELDERKY